MDPVTHALLGAAVQETGLRQKIGRDAAIAGMLAGIAPDGDIVMLKFGEVFFTNPQAALVLGHRGISHSLAAVVILPLIISGGWWCIRTAIIRRRNPKDEKPASFAWLYICCLLGVVAHVLLDACTSYGTMLYWPFSTSRVAWDCVAIIDPVFTLIPAVVLFGCWRIRRKKSEFASDVVRRTKKIGRWGVVLCVWYMLLGISLHYSVIERSIPSSDRSYVLRAGAYPVIPSLCQWRVVWETPDGWHVGKVNIFSRGTVIFRHARQSQGQLVDLSRDTEFYRAFSDFAGNMVRADVQKDGSITEIVFHDMRYGWPVDSTDGMWAYVFEYDGTGHLVSHGRIHPGGRRGISERVKNIFKK